MARNVCRLKPNETSIQVCRGDEVSLADEARSIQSSALAGQGRVVKLDQIVFFSTETGDAWMLDPDNGCAVCLAREFEPRPIAIQETRASLAVGWNADYRIEDDAFTVAELNGSVRTILGYPTEEFSA
jgi:hypothetical protein